jgi:nitrite reductase/ring-hydroxylating ferredoxin subunit/DMSO/TMAO reductase YedYZ heme-binding membrane subunit
MSVRYNAVLWNRQKKVYDVIVAALSFSYIVVFAGLGSLIHPNATIETLLIRALGTLAFLMLHIVLCIGPLCRLDRRFLPLLYNRRHLGVATFLVGLSHGVFSLIQFHALGDVNPLVSLLSSNTRFDSVAQFPFQLLGFLALLILFLMAATSHDFWLHNLTPVVWKRLHMMVYAVYALLVGHVGLGALQSETSPILVSVVATGLVVVCTLHLLAGKKETATDSVASVHGDKFVEACDFESIPEKRARVVVLKDERIAIFRHDGKVSAVSNVCRHQNGPLGEGKIIDGCITCPWHGYQYIPETGASPPPFTDKVATYETRIVNGKVLLNPCPR